MKFPGQAPRLAAAATICAASLAGIVHGAAFGSSSAAIRQLLSATVLACIVFGLKGHVGAKRQLAVIGCFWIASYAVGLRWLWGGLTAPDALEFALGSMVFAAAILVLSCLTVLTMWIAVLLLARSRFNAANAALLAASLLIADSLRELIFPGFPWLSIGYAHVSSPFASLLPLIGVQGTGWMIESTTFLLGGLMASLMRQNLERNSMLIGLVGIALLLTGARFMTPVFTHDDAPIKVALLQTAVGTREKFSTTFLHRQLTDIVEFAKAQDARLVVTPETALPTSLDALSLPQIRLLQSSVSDTRAVILGTFSQDSNFNGYNSAVLMQTPPGRTGVKRTTYLKRHLAPLGEYAPAGLRWLANLLGMPVSNLTVSHTARTDFYLPGLTVIPSVCGVDLAYGNDLRNADAGPRMLVNLSNPIFFASPIARDQYVAIARARALEQQIPVLIAANYAPTAVIAGDGTIMGILPQGRPGILSADVRPRSGSTPYSRQGDLFSAIVMGLFAGSVLLLLWRRLNLHLGRGQPRLLHAFWN